MGFQVSRINKEEKQSDIQALVLPKVTSNLPTVPVSFVTKLKFGYNLEFADPDYGTLTPVDLLLGDKVFSKAVLHGQQFGPL